MNEHFVIFEDSNDISRRHFLVEHKKGVDFVPIGDVVPENLFPLGVEFGETFLINCLNHNKPRAVRTELEGPLLLVLSPLDLSKIFNEVITFPTPLFLWFGMHHHIFKWGGRGK
jgi:hypothetical protein